MSVPTPTAAADIKRDIRISKSLSKLLRHQAQRENLSIDSRGYVPVDQILGHNYLKSNKASLADLQRVVAGDSKSRYSLELRKDGKFYICANQGHSIATIETDLVPLTSVQDFPTEMVVHGTSKKNWKLIETSGYLSKMNRNHIHFATGLPRDKEVISGMRPTATVLLFLDIERALRDGYPFWKSTNGVVLSEGKDGKIPLEYFKVQDSRPGVQ